MAALLIRKLNKSHLKDLPILLRNCALSSLQPDYIYFNSGFTEENDKTSIVSGMKVYEDFITETEENSLIQEVEPHLKRLRYERTHWDKAITGYRETERTKWNQVNSEVIERVKKFAFKDSVPLKHVHVLDLEENGVIMPHIDSVKFCGCTIAGLSLLTDSIMRLVHDKNKTKIVDVLLKKRSLYVMTGSARYDFTHEILGNNDSVFNGQAVKKKRRISVICRNEP